MAHEIRTIYPCGLNKGFCLKFQCISPEEGQKHTTAKMWIWQEKWGPQSE